MTKEITVASECETSIDSRKKSDRRKKWGKFIRKDKIVFNDKFAQAVFLLPAILVFSVFTVYPAFTSLYYSFTDWTGIGTNYNFVGFANYAEMFRDKNLFQTLPVTFYYAALNAVTLLFVAFFIALMLNRQSIFTSFMRVCFFIPMLVSPLIVGFVFKEFYAPTVGDETGSLNKILMQIGLGFLSTNWLGNEYTAMIVIVLTGVWYQVGQTALIYLATMQGISAEYYEAATLDGAGYWKRTYHITWKLMGPALMVNTILLLINSLKQYDMIALLTNGGPGTSTKVINLAIVELSIASQKVGLGCAMSMVVTAFTFVLVSVTQKLLSRRATAHD